MSLIHINKPLRLTDAHSVKWQVLADVTQCNSTLHCQFQRSCRLAFNNPAWCPGKVNLESLNRLNNTPCIFRRVPVPVCVKTTCTHNTHANFILYSNSNCAFDTSRLNKLLKSNSYLLNPVCLTKLYFKNVFANLWQDILYRTCNVRRLTTLCIYYCYSSCTSHM